MLLLMAIIFLLLALFLKIELLVLHIDYNQRFPKGVKMGIIAYLFDMLIITRSSRSFYRRTDAERHVNKSGVTIFKGNSSCFHYLNYYSKFVHLWPIVDQLL